MLVERYSSETEQRMRTLYRSLNEKDRRRYAAVEADKLGYGGQIYISALLGCDPKTLQRGLAELDQPPDLPPGRIRKKGGRKCCLESTPELVEAFQFVIGTYTAGDPVHEGVLWTNLRRPEIAARLGDEGFPVSVTVVDRLLEKFEMDRREPQKIKTMSRHPDRNAQFEFIHGLKEYHRERGEPVLSIDTKKREILGQYARPGRVLCRGRLPAWDHDFPTHSPGVVIPHGIFDFERNEGFLHLGVSHDTSQFAADALLDWWRSHGQKRYPRAEDLLLLCDAGGSNSYRHLAFKEELQRVADQSGLCIRVAHYPPGCSKYNPIEHRFFPHVTRECQGVFLHSVEQARDLMRKATTVTGLQTFARIVGRVYQKGRKAIANSVDDLCFAPDDFLPDWNYLLCPRKVWELI